MKKLFAMLCIFLLPTAALAEERMAASHAVQQADMEWKSREGMSSGNIAAIGVGIIGGLVVLDGMLGVPAAVAALAGGLGGHWWYKTYEEENIVSFQFRKPSHFSISQAAGVETQRSRWLGDEGI